MKILRISHPNVKHPINGPNDVEIPNKKPWFRGKEVFNMNGGRDDFVHDSPSYQLKEVAKARVNHPQFTIWLVVLTILKDMKVNGKDDIYYGK